MNLFYTPELVNGQQYLSEEESKHCLKVLRMKVNDILTIVDGVGGFYKAAITVPDVKACGFEIVEKIENYEKRPFKLHLAVAPTKNTDRYEWLVEKATEIGVDEITPIICEHSERKNINTERLNRIAISAMKQSVKAYLPKINEAIKLKDFFGYTFDSQKYMGHCTDEQRHNIKNTYKLGTDALVLIGPEGDFSNAEIKKALNIGYLPITLGKSRLRTETAAIVACQIINFLNE